MAILMKASQLKAVLTVMVAALVVIISAVVLTKTGVYDQGVSQDPIALRKVEILTLSSSGRRPSQDDRETVLQYLSGPAMLQYDFTQEEKMKIIRFLNE